MHEEHAPFDVDPLNRAYCVNGSDWSECEQHDCCCQQRTAHHGFPALRPDWTVAAYSPYIGPTRKPARKAIRIEMMRGGIRCVSWRTFVDELWSDRLLP
jgi:hypothetical protein